MVWDENDYAVHPIVNQVVTIVDTNYGFHQLASGQFYTHFSLLRSIEGGFGLPCLNHACDVEHEGDDRPVRRTAAEELACKK